jgi:diguanylate cyclase (GGDEF)-like protein
MSPARVWIVIAGWVFAAGAADVVTGPDVWLGPIYLIIICLPAWALGVRAAILVATACVIMFLAINGGSMFPLGPVAFTWNLATRILVVSLLIMLMVGLRRSYERERMLARSDSLTGLLNRQSFYEEVARHRATEFALLSYIDLDGFKNINDRHGHAAGDETLAAFARGVRTMIREDDLFARVGGDEFLLFVAARDEVEAHRLAKEMHLRINDYLRSLARPLRCSMGVVVIDTTACAFSDADVQLADHLMYRAKREGSALRVSSRQAAGDLQHQDGLAA